MQLSDLPVDIIYLIFAELSSPLDLHALLHSSRSIFLAFQPSRSRVLKQVLTKQITPAARHACISLLKTPSWTLEDPADEFDVETFLLEEFPKPITEFPDDYPSLLKIARIHTRLTRFIRHFIGNAWSCVDAQKVWKLALPWWSSLGDQRSEEHRGPTGESEGHVFNQISPTELERLQHAFYNYELYCQLFMPRHNDAEPSELTADQHNELFAAQFAGWQQEALLCVNHYYLLLAGCVVDYAESKFFAKLETLLPKYSRVQVPQASEPQPYTLSKWTQKPPNNNDNTQTKTTWSTLESLVPMSDLVLTDGTNNWMTIETLIAGGTGYLASLLLTPKAEKESLFTSLALRHKMHVPLFLNDAITMQSPYDEWETETILPQPAAGPNQAWGRSSGYYEPNSAWARRSLAWVFWDDASLAPPAELAVALTLLTGIDPDDTEETWFPRTLGRPRDLDANLEVLDALIRDVLDDVPVESQCDDESAKSVHAGLDRGAIAEAFRSLHDDYKTLVEVWAQDDDEEY